MLTRRSALTLFAGALALPGAARAQTVPQGYPAGYGDVLAKARQEGKVAVYTSTDLAQGQKLLDAFKAAFPGIEVEWNDQGTTSVFNRVISEAAAKQVGGDITWTSASDLQLSLVDRGLAATYRSPEAGKVPEWAIYKDAAYGTTLEPAAIIWNKRLLPADLVPKTHADLTRLMKERRDLLDGKVATFDPEKSGTGFMFAAANMAHVPDFWAMMTAFGAAHGKVYGGSGSMREKVASGEHLLAFDAVGSYATEWAKSDPNIGVGYLSDHVPAFSRVMLIPKGAPHPNAAQVFLDFALSPAGQRAVAEGGLPAVRSDVPGIENAEGLAKLVGGNLRPIPLSAKTTEFLDPKRRAEFFRQWRKAMQG